MNCPYISLFCVSSKLIDVGTAIFHSFFRLSGFLSFSFRGEGIRKIFSRTISIINAIRDAYSSVFDDWLSLAIVIFGVDITWLDR